MSTSTALAMQDPDDRPAIVIPPALAQLGVTVAPGSHAVSIPEALHKTHNVLLPVSEIAQSDPDYTPRLSVVSIDPTLDPPKGNQKESTGGRYVYVQDGELALNKNAILLLAHAAGIEVEVTAIDRAKLADNEIGYEAVAMLRRSDGTIAHYPASRVADKDVERERVKANCTWDGQFNKNKFIKRWATELDHLRAKIETKAILRAVSMALQLKRGGYSDAELRKPFLVVGWSFSPADPEVRRQRSLEAARGAYGRRALAPAPLPVELPEPEEDDDTVEVTPTEIPVQDEPPATDEDELPGEPEAVEESAPVAGEIPPGVVAAGEFVIPFGKHKGRKITEVAHDPKYPTQIKWLATEYAPGSAVAAAHAPLIEAARTWHNWASEQEAVQS